MYVEYKKPATKFPAGLDGFFFQHKDHSGSTISGDPHHRWCWRRKGYTLNKMDKGKKT